MEINQENQQAQKVQQESQYHNQLFGDQDTQKAEVTDTYDEDISQLIKYRKYKICQDNRKRLTNALLKNHRHQNLEKLTISSKQFLDLYFSTTEMEDISLHDLVRFKDLLLLVYDHQEDMFYYQYFEEKLKEGTQFVTQVIQHVKKIICLDTKQIIQKSDILLVLIEILSDITQFIPEKEIFVDQEIIQQDILEKLLNLSLNESDISNKIRTNTMLLIASLCELSQKIAEVLLKSGLLNSIQTFAQKKEFDIGFMINFTQLFQSILKWNFIQKEHKQQLLFFIEYILWILFEGLDKISFEPIQFIQVSKNICQSFNTLREMGDYQGMVMSQNLISKILVIISKNFNEENKQFVETYNHKVKCFYKLLLQIAKEMNKNSKNFDDLFQWIEKEQNLRVLTQIIHNNVFLHLKTTKLSLRVAQYLVEISPVILDSLFTNLFISKLVNMLDSQPSYVELILSLLQFLILMGDQNQLKYLIESTSILESTLNLLILDSTTIEAKLKISELMQMFLKYGEQNLKTDIKDQKEINLIQLRFERLNAVQVIQKEIMVQQNSELVLFLQSIIETYFN
ncbi:hypothetical protein TTHERM_00572190 (macronuclear) [Tetrahymena thermophila SB210]|uniref:Armadillo-type fold n=1 Tax=Tetrahymena thermophila (strain SB210) TaxID=312017 RepID=Q24HV5_TETTS|nr:hypothetical protein TTHERM_00572190 [Tetrahymena thermophila SB210]EAS07483.3 hypothetical protein TTHERM_00572190 [Tetrahymena thermophila SB210]|eukprot:XP_001027725.3 hypothetical protein TTHERM_00572190 [Tetrahymena thermophila SB210]